MREDAVSKALHSIVRGCSLSVCFRCRPPEWKGEDDDRPGVVLAEAIEREAHRRGVPLDVLRDVRCMSQCKRPCVVAFSAPGKFTYLFGDLDPATHAADILDAFVLYASRADGFMERFERPEIMRAGILGRIPPMRGDARLVEARPGGRVAPLRADLMLRPPDLMSTP